MSQNIFKVSKTFTGCLTTFTGCPNQKQAVPHHLQGFQRETRCPTTYIGCPKQKQGVPQHLQGVKNRNKVSHNIYRVNKTETGCSKQKQGVKKETGCSKQKQGVRKKTGCSKQKQGVQNRNRVFKTETRYPTTFTGWTKQKQGVQNRNRVFKTKTRCPTTYTGCPKQKGCSTTSLGCPKQKHLNLFLSLFFCHKSTDRCYKIMRVVKKSCRIISDLGFSIFGLVFFRNQYRVFEFRSNPPMNVNMNLIINDLHQFFIMERDQRLTLWALIDSNPHTTYFYLNSLLKWKITNIELV